RAARGVCDLLRNRVRGDRWPRVPQRGKTRRRTPARSRLRPPARGPLSTPPVPGPGAAAPADPPATGTSPAGKRTRRRYGWPAFPNTRVRIVARAATERDSPCAFPSANPKPPRGCGPSGRAQWSPVASAPRRLLQVQTVPRREAEQRPQHPLLILASGDVLVEQRLHPHGVEVAESA